MSLLARSSLRSAAGLLPCALAAGVLGLFEPSPARAASLPFQASLAFQIGLLDPISLAGSGVAQVTANGGQLETFAIPAGVFDVENLAIDLGPLGIPPFGGLLATVANQAGNFTRAGDTLAGPMALAGSLQICLGDACTGDPLDALSIPVDVIGIGGSSMASSEALSVSLVGAPWTTGVVAAGGVLAGGFLHGADPDSVIGTTLRLVTPIVFSTDAPGFESLGGFGFLTLQIVPEPGTILLLGSGLASLAVFGRSRRRLPRSC